MMIPLFKVLNARAILPLVERTLMSGYVGQGPRVKEFEQLLSARMEGRTVLTLNSCTSALDLALHLIGVGSGDVVITTPQTCTATNGVIVNRGANILWADIDPSTGNIDPTSVATRFQWAKGRVKAVMAVDWGGRACDYDALRKAAPGVPIVEDAAHAFATLYKGHHVAKSGGDYVCFSFQAIKHLNTGDGGAIVVPDDQIARATLLRWYGLDRESSASFRCAQTIHEAGFKYHMNDIAAAIGIGNLDEVDDAIADHVAHAKRYCEAFADIPGLRAPAFDGDSSWWIYSILVDEPNRFIAAMAERGIDCSPVHARNDKHPAFQRARIGTCHLPGVDAFNRGHVAIPVGWWLSDDDVTTVIEATREAANETRFVS